MLPIGTTRYIDFRLADVNGNPIPGRTLAVWVVAPNSLTLLRNMQTCSDALSLQDYGNGMYTVSYTPSTPGHDLLVIYDHDTDIRVIDSEDILPADFAIGSGASGITLTQDYGGTDALRATGLADDPTTYKLLVFTAADWIGNRRADANSLGITGLDAAGRWLMGIQVGPGIYNLVVRKPGQTYVIAYNLTVGSS